MLGSGYDLGKDGGYLGRLRRYLKPADVLFAEAAISEAQVWTRINYDRPTYAGQPIPRVNHFYTRVDGAFKRSLERAEARLEVARKLPEVAAEATVRIGVIRLARGTAESREAAVALFREAQAMKPPPDIAYLACLFEGKALDRPGTLAEGIEPNRAGSTELGPVESGAGNLEEAIQAYRRAFEILPHAYSGRIALAGALFRDGDITGAAALVNLALSQPDTDGDPWSLYWSSQYRHWPARLAALREATR
jgi:tetratricopeptide (TPR) repeat protein